MSVGLTVNRSLLLSIPTSVKGTDRFGIVRNPSILESIGAELIGLQTAEKRKGEE